jgi:hypothetical protein
MPNHFHLGTRLVLVHAEHIAAIAVKNAVVGDSVDRDIL